MSCTLAICTYTEDRYPLLVRAVASIERQTGVDVELLIVVDHNDALLRRASADFPGATVLPNEEQQGLSGARNTALAHCRTELLGFVDDDGELEPTWGRLLLERLEDPDVIGVGSLVVPDWETGRPAWLAPEFDWVIGCSYRGLPTTPAPIRNPSGGAMILRTGPLRAIGGFRTDLGRVGTVPLGCEETDAFIRLHDLSPRHVAWFEPDVAMRHFVPASRCTWSYFRRRCYAEGLSKALVGSMAAHRQQLGPERRHLTRTLPAAVGRELRSGNLAGVAGLALGVAATIFGYLSGRTRARLTASPARERALAGR
jgi:glycosyltransferase involved in cell wall biosynthesis